MSLASAFSAISHLGPILPIRRVVLPELARKSSRLADHKGGTTRGVWRKWPTNSFLKNDSAEIVTLLPPLQVVTRAIARERTTGRFASRPRALRRGRLSCQIVKEQGLDTDIYGFGGTNGKVQSAPRRGLRRKSAHRRDLRSFEFWECLRGNSRGNPAHRGCIIRSYRYLCQLTQSASEVRRVRSPFPRWRFAPAWIGSFRRRALSGC